MTRCSVKKKVKQLRTKAGGAPCDLSLPTNSSCWDRYGPCSLVLSMWKKSSSSSKAKGLDLQKSVDREYYYYEGEMEQETTMMTPMEKPQPGAWKLYDNPHFSHPYKCFSNSRSSLHSRNFSDFFRSMEREPNLSDLDNAMAHIKQLKAELDSERRMRRKAELMNGTLARALQGERRRRESAEEACRKLTDEIACVREEAERSEEERRMLRVAEALREVRVQMKLAEERLLMEEKITEARSISKDYSVEEKTKMIKGAAGADQKKEVENPHIKRGIKGLEFRRAVRVRAGGAGTGTSPSSNSKEGRGGLGSHLECQRAQLRVLLRQRNPAGSGLMGAMNLVML